MNCVDYLFNESKTLSKPLVLNAPVSLTYSDLWFRIAILSDYLNVEIGSGKTILLASPNNLFFIQCYFAIMKSGNVCVPLNPYIDKESAAFIMHKTNASLAFFTQQVANKLGLEINTLSELFVDDYLANAVIPQTSINDNDTFDSTALAQIIFTSGSTAEPKGVMISHRNIIANTGSIIKYLQLTETDIMEVVLPFYYCYGLSLLHTHIKVGGQVVLNNTFMLLGSVLNDLVKYKCTGFAGVPSHYQVLLRKSDSFKNSEFPSLRYVTQAGGKLHNAFIKEFLECKPNTTLYVMYGQTEATARLSYLPPTRLADKLGSIGKGIPDVELKVVNSDGQTIQPGETGEIIAKGDNIMMGYLNDVESTQKVLRNGWLHTGDLATIDEDGFIFLQARSNEIAKVRGHRISPKEIEEVIVMLGGVIDCTIRIIEDAMLGEAIKAVVTTNLSISGLTEEVVRQHCASKLAIHKVPSYIEFVENVDIAATGKKLHH